jgi:ABC-type transporter Mla subunit MlaD
MPPQLHLHPERLLVHAAAASGLSDELQAVLRSAPVVDAIGAELDRLRGTAAAAARELAELSAALAGAAAAANAADADASAVLARLRDVLGPERA